MNNELKIGELSKLARVSDRTIRYYEEIGLIKPSSVTSGGMRIFSKRALHRLEIIKTYKELGLELSEIKNLLPLETGQTKAEMLAGSRKILTTQLDRIAAEIDYLQDIKKKHLLHLKLLDICENCKQDTCPKDCQSKNAYI